MVVKEHGITTRIVMQAIIDALRERELKDCNKLLKKVREIKAATLELAGEPDAEIANQAKRLWNAVVALSVETVSLDKQKLVLLASCRELAYLTLNLNLRRPLDDTTLCQLLEMVTRLARCYNIIEDVGQTRLYLSKAVELKEVLLNEGIVAPLIEAQINDSLCIFYVEKLMLELNANASELHLEHVTQEALNEIKEANLPQFTSDFVHRVQNSKSRLVLTVAERILYHIHPIESFPAHISDDLIYMMIDQCLAQGQKARLERAAALFESISLQNGLYFKTKLKFELVIGASKTDIKGLIVRCIQSGTPILGLLQLLQEALEAEGDTLLFEALEKVDERKLSDGSKSEYVEIVMMGMIAKDAGMAELFLREHIKELTQESRTRLQAKLLESAEKAKESGQKSAALALLPLNLALISDDSDLDKQNEPTICQQIISLMLELGRFDEAEEQILNLPFDLNGQIMRFQLAASVKRAGDAMQLLERIRSMSDVTVDTLLYLANIALSNELFGVLLKILIAVTDRFETDGMPVSLKLEILRSAANVVSQALPEEDVASKVDLMLKLMNPVLHLMISEDEVECADVFFKATWNAAVEAGRSELYAESASLFSLAYRMLGNGQWRSSNSLNQAKIACITAHLTAAFQEGKLPVSGRSLLQEAMGLMDEIELSSVYLPQQRSKRPKGLEREFEWIQRFDPIQMARTLSQLAFQMAVLEEDQKAISAALLSAQESLTLSGLEELLNWCLERRNIIPAESILELLQIMAQKVISCDEKLDLITFSFIYRGMAIFALSINNGRDGFDYFKQALAIIRAHSQDYPKEEVCWLSVASYNQALRISAMSAQRAQAWCEISLGLLHHAGQYREAYEATVRAGYSRILERLTN